MSNRSWIRTANGVGTVVLLLCLCGSSHAGRAVYKKAEIDVARVNVVREEYGKEILRSLLEEANRWVEVPDEKLRDLIRPVTPRGNATTCPVDGGSLECKMDAPWKLVCRTCGRRYPNDEYPDQGLGCKVGRQTYHFIGRCNAHHIGVLTGAAHDMALAYALTGKIEYACKSAVILTRLGEVYPGFATHDDEDVQSMSAGKACSSTQAESGWLKVVIGSYELLRDAHDPAGNPVISRDRKNVIENGLLREAAELLMKADYGMHSIQTAQNAALAAVGVCLDEPRYVHFAVDGPSGFRNMLTNGVLDDGTWHEGAIGYHNYATSCLLQLAHYTKGYSDPAGVAWSTRPDRYRNLDLEATPALGRMISVVNRAVLPDGTVPALNDSSPRKGIDDSDALAASHRLADQWGARMDWVPFRRMMHTPDFARLFRSEQTFPTLGAAPPTAVAYDLPGFGLAVLRSDLSVGGNLIALDRSMQTDEHTHPDLLQMLVLANGKAIASDYGRQQSVEGDNWASHTVAHNTVVVDRSDQGRDVVPRVTNLSAVGPIRVVQVDGSGAYKRCSEYRRAVIMVGRDYAVDVFRVRGGGRHEYAFHANGRMTVAGLSGVRRLTGAVSRTSGYRELMGFQRGYTTGDVEVIWRRLSTDDDTSAGLRLMMLGDGRTTVYSGPGFSSQESAPMGMILAGRGPGQNQFVTVVEPLTGLPRLKGAHLLKSRWIGTADKPACVVEVEGDNWTDHIEYLPGEDGHPASWSVTRTQQGRVRFLYGSNGASATGNGWTLTCAEPVIGKSGQVKFIRGIPSVMLDEPVTWGKASSGLDLVFGQASGRLSRYAIDRLTPVGNAAWASLSKDRGICLGVLKVKAVNVLTGRVDSSIPLPRRLEVIGKPVVRADGSYAGTVREIKILQPDWHPLKPETHTPPLCPVRVLLTDAKLDGLQTGEALRILDMTLRTPVVMESSALLEETAPDTYLLTAPLGVKLVIPTPLENTWVLWRQGEDRWQEITCEFSKTKSGYLMSVELPIEVLAEGPVQLRLTTGK